MKTQNSAKGKNKGAFGKVWKALVEFKLLLIAIATLAVAVCLHLLVFEDWWAIIFAAAESIVFFVYTQRERELSLRDYISWTLIVFAVFALTTPLFGTGLGWHLLGNIIGFIILFVIFQFNDLGSGDPFFDYAGPFFITLVVMFFAQLTAIGIDSAKEEEKQDLYYDSIIISETPYYKVEKVLTLVENGYTYFVVVTENDTLYLWGHHFPEAVFIDTASYVAAIKDQNDKIIRLEIK